MVALKACAVKRAGAAISADLERSSKYKCRMHLGRSGLGFDKKRSVLSVSRA